MIGEKPPSKINGQLININNEINEVFFLNTLIKDSKNNKDNNSFEILVKQNSNANIELLNLPNVFYRAVNFLYFSSLFEKKGISLYYQQY